MRKNVVCSFASGEVSNVRTSSTNSFSSFAWCCSIIKIFEHVVAVRKHATFAAIPLHSRTISVPLSLIFWRRLLMMMIAGAPSLIQRTSVPKRNGTVDEFLKVIPYFEMKGSAGELGGSGHQVFDLHQSTPLKRRIKPPRVPPHDSGRTWHQYRAMSTKVSLAAISSTVRRRQYLAFSFR